MFEDISNLGIERSMPLFEKRQLRLLNQLSLMVLMFAAIDAIINVLHLRFNLIYGDLLLIPVMAILPMLNARNKTLASRFLFGLVIQVAIGLSLLLEWESITIGIYLQHLLVLLIASAAPILFVNPWSEKWEFWLMFSTHVLLLVFVGGLPYVNGFFRPILIESQDFDLIIMGAFFIWICVIALSWFYKQGYLTYNEKMEEYRQAADMSQQQIDELSERNGQLEREIRKHHNQLYQSIAERTRVLEADNQRLREYALVNAHLVRAPLARIKGLSQLLELEEGRGNETTDAEVLHRLRESTQELENMIRRIQQSMAEQQG